MAITKAVRTMLRAAANQAAPVHEMTAMDTDGNAADIDYSASASPDADVFAHEAPTSETDTETATTPATTPGTAMPLQSAGLAGNGSSNGHGHGHGGAREPRRAGRRRMPVWAHFRDLGLRRAECNYCKEGIVNNPQRMLLHLSCKCKGVDSQTRLWAVTSFNETPARTFLNGGTADSASSSACSTPMVAGTNHGSNVGAGKVADSAIMAGTKHVRDPSAVGMPQPKRGRHRLPVWAHFVEVASRRAECKFCKSEHAGNPQRMLLHLASKCMAVNQETRAWALSSLGVNAGPSSLDKGDMAESGALPVDPAPRSEPVRGPSASPLSRSREPSPVARKPRLSVETASRPVDHAVDIPKFQDQLMLSLLTSDVPCDFLDNRFFREAIATLCPGMQPLDQHTALGSVIDRLHAATKENQEQALRNARHVTLLCDGASKLNHQQSMVKWFARDEANHCELINVEVGETQSLGVDNVVNSMCSNARMLRAKSSAAQIHFTCDSLVVYAKAKKALAAQPDIPLTLTGGCLTHQTNLLLKDLIDIVPEVSRAVAHASVIANAVNGCSAFSADLLEEVNLHRVASNLKPLPSLRICTPTPTQWSSYATCLKQALALGPYLQSAVDGQHPQSYMAKSKLVEPLKDFVHDAHTWDGMAAATVLLEPFSFAAGITELEHATSGQILLVWIWLLARVNNSKQLTQAQRDAFETQFTQRMMTSFEDHHFVCLVLDPRIRGVGLSGRGFRLVRGLALALVRRAMPNFQMNQFLSAWSNYLKRVGDFDGAQCLPYDERRPVHYWQLWRGDEGLNEIFTLGESVTSYQPFVVTNDELWKMLGGDDRRWSNEHMLTNMSKVMAIKHHNSSQGPRSRGQVVRKSSKVIVVADAISVDNLFVGEDGVDSNIHGFAEDEAIQDSTSGNECTCANRNHPRTSLRAALGRLEDIVAGETDEALSNVRFEISWLDTAELQSIEKTVKSFFEVFEDEEPTTKKHIVV